jgi:methylglyoxal synthase
MIHSFNHYETKRIAIVSYRHKKKMLIEWAYDNKDTLSRHKVIAAGTTGSILEGTLEKPIKKLASILCGGDRQLATMIKKNQVDILIFFCDAKKPNRRDNYIRELLQLAINTDTIVACNRATADLLLKALRPDSDKQSALQQDATYIQEDLPIINNRRMGTMLAAV